jgi:hypothetical protein
MIRCPKCETELNEQQLCPVCDNYNVPPSLPPNINSKENKSNGSNSPINLKDRVGSTAPTEQDYIDFLGPNADTYLSKFAKFKRNGVESYAFTWHWPAFFFNFWWFLYRKEYIWFLVALAAFFFGPTFIIGWVVFPLLANYLYYRDATNKIKQLKANHPNYAKSDLAILGGTNGWAPWVAIIATIGIVLLGVLAGSAVMYIIFNWPEWMQKYPGQLEF